MQNATRYRHAHQSGRPFHPHDSVSDLDEHSQMPFDDDQLSASDHDPDPALPRMSLGPKMRFHSRAPWELDDGVLPEEGDPEYPRPFSALKKGLTFSITKSPESGRASGESYRSQAKSKCSFETTSSQVSYPRGALYALAQESLSTSSLVSSGGPYVSRRKSSLNRTDAPSPPDARFEESLLRPNQQRHLTRNAADDCHPYANPDLVTPYPSTQSPIPTELGILRTDSITTMADSIASTPQRSPRPTGRSPTSVLQGTTVTSLSTDIIRSPLPSETLANGSIAARTDRDIMRPFTLISLEEARAQRSGSAITKATQSDLLDHSATVPDTRDEAENETHRPDNIVIPSRTRGRSMSASAKAKTAVQSIIGAGNGPKSPGVPSSSGGTSGKALKHKKSGLMRLFNGRAVDKEEKPLVPPMPTLSNEYITHPRVSRTAPHTLPSNLPTRPSVNDEPLHHARLLDQKSFPNLRRQIPHLSIDTEPWTCASRGPISAAGDVSFKARDQSRDLSEGQKDPLPQSAPANASDFPKLKLRPVSTVFSAHFTEHMISRGSLSSADTELDTPSSASMSKGFPPRTPSSVARSTYYTRPPESIYELQEQNVTEWPEEPVYQRERTELECRVRELEKELEKLRESWKLDGYCGVCGRGQRPSVDAADNYQHPQDTLADKETFPSIMHRPRARTVTSSRFNSPVS